MLQRCFVFSVLSVGLWSVISCSSAPDGPLLIGDRQAVSTEGESLYQKALKADQAGKESKAAKLYGKMATQYPYAPSAATARYREALLLDQMGETENAFESYNKYLERFPGTANYSKALERMAAIANDAAEGRIQHKVFGVKSKFSTDQVVKMLGKVRDQAPKSLMAAKAQFAIADAYVKEEKYIEAVDQLKKLVSDQPASPMAPEALFRIGMIQLKSADTGNQNQAMLDLSREAFNDYLIQYPGHARNAEARQMMQTLNGRDLQRSFDIAEFYVKTKKIESAKVYYRDILKRSQSGELHDAAKARLQELGN